MGQRRLAALGLTVVLMAALTGSAGCDSGPAPIPVVPGWWRSNLANVPLGTATVSNATGTALARQWSHYGQGQENEYGRPVVVSSSRERIPKPPAGGDKVLRLEHRPGDPATQRKLYKSFSAVSWPRGTEPFSQDDGTPSDVSGRYFVYQYVSSKQLRLTDRGWINLAQFKEGYSAEDGTQTSDPSWWLVLYQRNGELFLDLAHWKEGRIAGRRLDFKRYLDRWLKIEMRLYQHDRVEVYVNDVLFDVGRQREYPVGRMRYQGVPVDQGGPRVTRPEGWIFGAGNYSNPEDPASGSLVHAGLATVIPLPKPAPKDDR